MKFYTGLLSLIVLKAVCQLVVGGMPKCCEGKLTAFQEMMVLLAKVWLALPVQGLTKRMGVCDASISRILRSWCEARDI